MSNENQNQGTWAEPSQFTAESASSYAQPTVSGEENTSAGGQTVSAPTYGTAAYQPEVPAYAGAPAPHNVVQNKPLHVETEETKRLKENYSFFGPAAFSYAVFYAFCMFRNGSGVTYPFFVAGSLLLLCLSLSK